MVLAKSVLHRFYSKHAPSKIEKIPKAFAYYKRKGKREEKLFKDLEKKYHQEVKFDASEVLMEQTSQLQVASVECATGKLNYAGCALTSKAVESMHLNLGFQGKAEL